MVSLEIVLKHNRVVMLAVFGCVNEGERPGFRFGTKLLYEDLLFVQFLGVAYSERLPFLGVVVEPMVHDKSRTGLHILRQKSLTLSSSRA
jgi:hypothetical protein